MKGLIGEERRPQHRSSRSDWILGAIAVLLLLNIFYSRTSISAPASAPAVEHDTKIFICHAPQPRLLNTYDIDRSAFDADIKWVKSLLQEVIEGGHDYGDAADSVSLSIFLPNGEPIVETGFGKLRGNETESRAPDGDSIYRMASITKMFTTAQLILQKQQGKLDLDQDVSKILSDFNPTTVGWTGSTEERLVTIRQLLSHTSGIPRDIFGEGAEWPDMPEPDDNSTFLDDVSRAQMMAKVRYVPAVMPGYGTPVYSNIAFNVAGYVAQEVGEIPYEELLDRDIFKPLGMASASYERQTHLLDRVVVPSEPFSNWADVNMHDDNPAGGLYLSAADLRRFGQELLGPGKSADAKTESGQPLYTKLTTREWLRPVHVFDDGLMSVGLNWEIFTVPVGTRRMSLYCKGGTLPGYHTLFGVDPEREFGFALLISGEPTANTELGIRIMRQFAETLDKQRQGILDKELAGTYVHNSGDLIELEVIDGGMAMTQAVVLGKDLFEEYHLGEGEGDYAALWPTGEQKAWRIAIGRPPAQPYLGCMHKFATLDGLYSRGYPVDLLVIEDGKLVYPSVNRTFTKQ